MTLASLFDEHLRTFFCLIFSHLQYVLLVRPQQIQRPAKGDGIKSTSMYFLSLQFAHALHAQTADSRHPWLAAVAVTQKEKTTMKELDLYYCPYCGKIIAVVKKTNVPTVCCGEPMQLIVPGTVDASIEKHVPVIRQMGQDVIITVGSEEHPSTEAHHIQWIVLLTSKGLHARSIRPGEKPRAVFHLNENENVHAAMEYCNLHKLWRKDVA